MTSDTVTIGVSDHLRSIIRSSGFQSDSKSWTTSFIIWMISVLLISETSGSFLLGGGAVSSVFRLQYRSV